VEREIQPLPETTKVIAYDLNVHGMVDSNGKLEQNPRPARQYKQRLKLLYQRVSRSEKGKNDRKKACVKLEKIYLKIHNKREDFLHNQTTKTSYIGKKRKNTEIFRTVVSILSSRSCATRRFGMVVKLSR
jgi:transposase